MLFLHGVFCYYIESAQKDVYSLVNIRVSKLEITSSK